MVTGGDYMEEYSLAYGEDMRSFSLPRDKVLGVLMPGELPSPGDEGALVREAMEKPIGSPPLRDLVRPGERACIVVGDMTRLWARHHLMVPPILEDLNRGGISDENIIIVSATGAHRRQSREEHIQLVGREAAERVRMVDHDCQDGDLVDYGKTSYSTPVRINRHVAEGDRVILTGGIVYHFLAGYGGGKKAIMPGVADYEGVMANHRLSLNPGGPGLNPRVRAACLAGNPLSKDMMEAAEMVGADFIVNTIINDEHKIAGVVAGDMKAAHEAGCALVDRYFSVPVRERADLVIASCGGYPKDINLYQTYKTVHNMIPALKKGGVGILLTEAREGVGSDLFYDICTRYPDNRAREDELLNNFEISTFMGYTQLLWAQGNRIIALSEVPEDIIRRMNMTPVKTMEEALSLAGKWLGDRHKAYIMPEGSTTFPIFAGKGE